MKNQTLINLRKQLLETHDFSDISTKRLNQLSTHLRLYSTNCILNRDYDEAELCDDLAIEVKQEILNRFGDRIITTFETCDRNSRQGIENGLTDLYLLSRTCKIYGCMGSSFTEVASSIGGIELIVLSK